MRAEKTAPHEQGAAVRGYKIKRLIYPIAGACESRTGTVRRFRTAEEKNEHKEAIKKIRRRFRNR